MSLGFLFSLLKLRFGLHGLFRGLLFGRFGLFRSLLFGRFGLGLGFLGLNDSFLRLDFGFLDQRLSLFKSDLGLF